MKKLFPALILILLVLFEAGITMAETPAHLTNLDPDTIDWKTKDSAYWKSVLSEDRYRICRGSGTERPFSGNYCNTKAKGEYLFPVGGGPSSKTCPRCAPQREQRTSVRVIP